jgi:hypothetical protein
MYERKRKINGGGSVVMSILQIGNSHAYSSKSPNAMIRVLGEKCEFDTALG